MVDMTNDEITLCAEIARLRATNAALLKALKDITGHAQFMKAHMTPGSVARMNADNAWKRARAAIQQAESAS